MYYNGDLKGNPWPEKGYNHFSIGVDVGYRINSIFNLTLGYTYGKISGADSLVSGHEKRNLHFKSVINDFKLYTYIDLNAIRKKIWKKKLVGKQDWKPGLKGPDIILGIGLLKFEPKGYYDGEWYNLQPLGTEGQNLGGDYPETYKLWQFNVKYGLGLGWRFTRQFEVELQAVYTHVFTDYLDDVSGEYPEYNEIAKGPEGDVTTHFTYGGNDGSLVPKGSSRGNPEKNDGIMLIGLKVTYIFSRQEIKRLLRF